MNPTDPSPSTPPGEPAAGPPPIDVASLLVRCMNDPGFAALILGKFHAQLPALTQRAADAAIAGDAAAAGRAGHALKGAAANLSALDLQAAAQVIETAGGSGDLAAVVAGLPHVRRAADACRAYVPTLIADLQRPPGTAAAA